MNSHHHYYQGDTNNNNNNNNEINNTQMQSISSPSSSLHMIHSLSNIHNNSLSNKTVVSSNNYMNTNNNISNNAVRDISPVGNHHLKSPNNNHSTTNTAMITPHYHDMKSISSYSLNHLQRSAVVVGSSTTTSNVSTTTNSTSNTANLHHGHHMHQPPNKSTHNPTTTTTSEPLNINSYSNQQSHHGYSVQSSIPPSHPSSLTSLSKNSYPSSSGSYSSSNNNNMQNPYQKIQSYTSSSSFPSSTAVPTSHVYSSQHVSNIVSNNTTPTSPISKHSSHNHLQSAVAVSSNSSTPSAARPMWSSQDKLPNMKDMFGNSSVVTSWSSSMKQERLPSLMDNLPSYNNNSSNVMSHVVDTSTTHPSAQQEYLATTSLMEELQQKLEQQEATIRRLERENGKLRIELDSFNTRSNIVPVAAVTGGVSSGKKRKGSYDSLEMKSFQSSSHSSNSSLTDPYSNSGDEDVSDVLDEDDDLVQNGSGKISKKRKHPSSHSKKSNDPSKKKISRGGGRRDATVGDLAKYTVSWKGEDYVLVNAFKNRTQILNYYVPLYQNNFPEKTCKLVLCNDEYKVLSSENPNTVEKKKHAWRVSVFTMDFYNFVKNFDKRTLKIINSSSGFIPNVNFEGPPPPSSNSTSPSIPTTTATTCTPSIIGSNESNTEYNNGRTPGPLLQPPSTCFLTPPNSSALLSMTPKPISTIHNK